MSNPIRTNIFQTFHANKSYNITAVCIFYFVLLSFSVWFHNIYCNRKQKPLDPLSHIRMCILSSTGIIIKSTVALTILCGHSTISHPSSKSVPFRRQSSARARHIKCPAPTSWPSAIGRQKTNLTFKAVVCAHLLIVLFRKTTSVLLWPWKKRPTSNPGDRQTGKNLWEWEIRQDNNTHCAGDAIENFIMAMATTKTKAMDTYFMSTKNDCPIERQETMWGPNARFMHSGDGGAEATIVMSVALLVSLSFKHTGGGCPSSNEWKSSLGWRSVVSIDGDVTDASTKYLIGNWSGWTVYNDAVWIVFRSDPSPHSTHFWVRLPCGHNTNNEFRR